jgi:tRNA (guanine37-N1)-methyltransferase
MRIDVITLFPQFFGEPLKISLLGRAIERGLLEVAAHDLRAYGLGPHRSVDDQPYGGGAGMVMRPEPIFAAVNQVRTAASHVVLTSTRGAKLDHAGVVRLARKPHLVVVCGRYEGVDERVAQHLVDEELSIGDYVLAGGEVPALVLIEAVSRMIPGTLGNTESLTVESHTHGLLEHPQYTRPVEFDGHRVPEVLLSGDHGAIARWRRGQSEKLTRERRPDLLP